MSIDPWILFTLIASLCFSSMSLLFRKLADLGTSTESINVFFFAGATLAIWIVAQWRHATLVLPAPALPWLLLTILIAVAANHFSISAFRNAPNVGLVTALRSLDVVLVTTGSIFFLRSSTPSLPQLLGVTLCIAGVLLISLGAT